MKRRQKRSKLSAKLHEMLTSNDWSSFDITTIKIQQNFCPSTVKTSRLGIMYPYTAGTQKAARISNKNSCFNWAHSTHTGSTKASHSTDLFTNSRHHISTND